ncbi:HNH endonuclease [Pseudomonas silesiensis]|uniref:HNH endonuclease n=1 Tax=Pseudomonas silesiensis TaxID=1853130 RepID=UPI0034D79D9E
MIEVNFSISERATIDNYEHSINKSASDWTDKIFDLVKKSIKDHYLKEQNYTCSFCKQKIRVKHNRAWDTEHIISRSSHPAFMFHPQNLCVTCIDCNTEKSSKEVLSTPKQKIRFPNKSSAYIIIHPHFDTYDDHLKVIVAGQLYEWKTPKGRATLNIYGLDRFLKVADRTQLPDPNVRRLMMAALTSKDDVGSYGSFELELLEHLALKHSKKLGPQMSIDIIKKLKEA